MVLSYELINTKNDRALGYSHQESPTIDIATKLYQFTVFLRKCQTKGIKMEFGSWGNFRYIMVYFALQNLTISQFISRIVSPYIHTVVCLTFIVFAHNFLHKMSKSWYYHICVWFHLKGHQLKLSVKGCFKFLHPVIIDCLLIYYCLGILVSFISIFLE